MNKKLLRQIKQEGYIVNTFKEGKIHSDIICEYLGNKTYPDITLMSDNELETCLEELFDWSWRILPSISPQFREEYYWQYGGEVYDITDELEFRQWKWEQNTQD